MDNQESKISNVKELWHMPQLTLIVKLGLSFGTCILKHMERLTKMPSKENWTQATVKVKGEITGGTFEAYRTFVYKERTNDIGLCNMMIMLLNHNPSIKRVDSIQVMESGPYDILQSWLDK